MYEILELLNHGRTKVSINPEVSESVCLERTHLYIGVCVCASKSVCAYASEIVCVPTSRTGDTHNAIT